MFAVALDTSNELAKTLLIHYSFDLNGYSASELVARWQNQYPLSWLHLAVIEALYQGRYKAISVQQILALWQRRGQANFHFNVEFESLICSRFPEKFTALSTKSRLNQPKNNTQVRNNNYLSPVFGSHAEVDNLASSNNQVNNGKEYTSQESTSEIPSFLRLAHRHRYPVTNIDSSIDTDRDNVTESKSSSPQLTDSSISYTNHELLAEAIHQSAAAIATATATALAIPEVVAVSPVIQQLVSGATPFRANLEEPHLNHPPIGQFTPEHSDRSEFFTSKLKAISTHQVPQPEN
jgi:hypothetical protein